MTHLIPEHIDATEDDVAGALWEQAKKVHDHERIKSYSAMQLSGLTADEWQKIIPTTPSVRDLTDEMEFSAIIALVIAMRGIRDVIADGVDDVAALQVIRQQRDRAEAEVERLQREGTVGVMHEVDRAFYDLTVRERDYERFRVDSQRREIQLLADLIEKLVRNGAQEPDDATYEERRVLGMVVDKIYKGKETTN